LEVNATPDTAAESGNTYPAAPEAIGSPTSVVANAVLPLGQLHYVRPVLVNSDGRYVGQEQVFWTSRAQLENSGAPAGVVPGVPATFYFTPDGWAGFEGEVDTDPAVGVETYSAVDVTTVPGSVTAVLPQAGAYRFRVRPVEAGCPTAPWTVSAPVSTGSYFYVSPTGSGDLSGSGPSNAAAGLGNALATADAGAEIRAAEGTYDEGATLSIPSSTRLLGGYRADFMSRDPSTFVSTVNVDSGTAVYIPVGATSATMIDGFVFHGADTTSQYSHGVMEGGSDATISNNEFRPGVASNWVYGVYLLSGSNATVTGNRVVNPDAVSMSYGIQAEGPFGTPTIQGNWVTARWGIDIQAAATAENNRVDTDPYLTTTIEPIGIRCSGPDNVVIRGNEVNVGGPDAAGYSYGIKVSDCNDLVIEGNLVNGGNGGISTGIDVARGVNVFVINNIVAGSDGGTTHRGIRCRYDPAVISNNTIYAGNAADSQGIYIDFECSPSITNNLLLGEGSWVGIFEYNSAGVPLSVENNVWLGTGMTLYEDYLSSTSYADVATMESSLVGLGTASSGNYLPAAAPSAVFVSDVCADGQLETLDDNDWRLNTSDTGITGGGKDTSQSDCGGASCGNVTTDYDGITRSVPYSAGAFE